MENWKKVLREVKDSLEPEREMGVIKHIYGSYGFIRVYPVNEPRMDYFFHAADMEKGGFKMLEEGDIVSFKPSKDEKGLRANDLNVEIENHLRKRKSEVL